MPCLVIHRFNVLLIKSKFSRIRLSLFTALKYGPGFYIPRESFAAVCSSETLCWTHDCGSLDLYHPLRNYLLNLAFRCVDVIKLLLMLFVSAFPCSRVFSCGSEPSFVSELFASALFEKAFRLFGLAKLWLKKNIQFDTE